MLPSNRKTRMSPLQQELNTFMDGVRTQVPAEVLQAVDQAYAALVKSNLFDHALKVGDKAPDFALPNAHGQLVALPTLLQQGPVVLSFNRGAWCPFCNIELRSLQAALPALRARNANVVAVSPELPDYSLPLIERQGLAFEVLTDHGNDLARKFGLSFALEGELKRISVEVFGVDLPKFNGDTSWEIPVPATYVIGSDGVILLAYVDPEFRNRLDPADILRVLA